MTRHATPTETTVRRQRGNSAGLLTTIPAPMVKAMGIKPGDILGWYIAEDGITFRVKRAIPEGWDHV